MATSQEILFIMKMQDQASANINVINNSITNMGRASDTAKDSVAGLAGVAGAFAGAFAAFEAGNAVIRGTIGVYKDYELGMANVRKTTGLTVAEMKIFSKTFDEFASRTPVSVKQLNEIAAAAGSLGVEGVPQLMAVIKAVAEIGTTTNLKGEEAAKVLVRTLNVFKESPLEIGRLASQLVVLDNTTAATAKEIANIGTQVALSTSAFQVGSGNAYAIGAAMAELGIRAELGGTAVGRAFTALDRSVHGDLPKGIAVLTQLFGKSAAELKKMQEADPTQFFQDFIKNLASASLGESQMYAILADLTLNQNQTNKSLVPLIYNYERLAEKLAAVRKEGLNPTAQAREFAIFTDTISSQLQILSNNWELFGKNVGESMSVHVMTGIRKVNEKIKELNVWFLSLTPNTRTFIAEAAVLATTFVALAAGAIAVVTAIRILSALLVSTPVGLAVTAFALLGTGVLAMNGYFAESIKLTEEEANKLGKLSESAEGAAKVMDNLTRAQGQNMQLALTAKLDAAINSLKTINTAMTDVADGGAYVAAMAGAGMDRVTKHLIDLTNQWRLGVIGPQAYRDELWALKDANPAFTSQVAQILALTGNWEEAMKKIAEYRATLSRLGDVMTLPEFVAGGEHKGNPVEKPLKVIPSNPNESHDRQVADFLKDSELKLAALRNETIAYALGRAESFKANLEAKQAAEVNALERRGIDLKIPGIKAMAAAYREALIARDAGKIKQDVTTEEETVNRRIKVFQEEIDALGQGTAAYEMYKRHRNIENEGAAIETRLLKLGEEADAAHRVAQAYIKMAEAHAVAGDKAEIATKKQRDAEQVAKGLGNEFVKSAEGILFQGKSLQSTANEFAKAVAQIVVKAAILIPLQNAISQAFQGVITPGSQKSTANGGGLFGSLLGMSGGLFANGTGAVNAASLASANQLGATGTTAAFDDIATAAGSGGGFLSGIGSWLTGFFHHSGGMAGEGQAYQFPAHLFDNAPKYHSGLGNDEFAAILKRGERVLTDAQNDNMAGVMNKLTDRVQLTANGGSNVTHHHWNITTPDVDSFRASQAQIMAKAGSAINRATTRR